MEITKKYGVVKKNICRKGPRYVIVDDIEEKTWYNGEHRVLFRAHNDLNYARLETAIKNADDFIRGMYKPFKNFHGEQVTFKLINIGLVTE